MSREKWYSRPMRAIIEEKRRHSIWSSGVAPIEADLFENGVKASGVKLMPLYVMLANLILFAALFNAVCLHSACLFVFYYALGFIYANK